MDPNDPWAVPPVNMTGDTDPYITFGAVGAALSDWERMEAHLSLIFTALIGLGEEAHGARRAYGTIVSFVGRAQMIKAAAEAYFTEYPEPTLQADIASLIRTAERASSRRNEIAHGIVQPLDPTTTVLTGGRYVLYPAFYSTAKRDMKHRPKYGYTSDEIHRFGRQFSEMVGPALDLLHRIYARHPQRP